MDTSKDTIDTVSFTVDAGLIDRLGKELVGRAETAVSELVKNSYDADATRVIVQFIDTFKVGGTIRIEDNGFGMTGEQLAKGFMRISTTDKIHNPTSPRFNRQKAGRKGIGRFATHFLGEKLVITTQTKESKDALQVTIDWNLYQYDQDISLVKNPKLEVKKLKEEGTILEISGVREVWSHDAIKRIFRYVLDLLQPDYLSDRSRNNNVINPKSESFSVKFEEINTIANTHITVADPDRMIFEKALAVIEGYVDKVGDGFCMVTSENLGLDKDIIIPIHNEIEDEQGNGKVDKKDIGKDDRNKLKFLNVGEVHFKVYYFIFDKVEYYKSNISKLELSGVKKISKEQGGVKMYRNGFRVLPYGEPEDDWLGLDNRYNFASGVMNIPFGNRNLFGFVEILDRNGSLFQETASREGLITNSSFRELQKFITKALFAGKNRISYGVKKIKGEKKGEQFKIENDIPKNLDTLENIIVSHAKSLLQDDESKVFKNSTFDMIKALRENFGYLLEELGMLRVLAGLGLTISEFTHEISQFTPSIYGDLEVLGTQSLNVSGLNSIENLKRTIRLFTAYTAYFSATVSANVSRELKVQVLDNVVNNFKKIVETDLIKSNIKLDIELYDFDFHTKPMHPSEWSSILFNLYTNSKKAIRRANVVGNLKIVVGKENGKIYLEFADNGDGIPEINREKIFSAFFTTSAPIGFDFNVDEQLTGTGLGLKIVKDIIEAHGGTISVIPPEITYNTCIRIEIPIATPEELKKYGF